MKMTFVGLVKISTVIIDSGPYHVLACAYCRPSPVGELVKDPLPRLALFLVIQFHDLKAKLAAITSLTFPKSLTLAEQ